MKRIILLALVMAGVCLWHPLAYGGRPTATIDTIYANSATNEIKFSVIYVWSASTTPDTIVLPGGCRNIDIIPWGTSSDTVQVSFAQPTSASKGISKYTEWVRGDGTAHRDFGAAYIKRLYVKCKSGSCVVWLRAY